MTYFSKIIIIGLLFMQTTGFGQDYHSDEEDYDFLTGLVSRDQLQSGKFGEYFSQNYKDYQPDNEIIQNLKNTIFTHKIQIIMATWCHDSQEQVPRFYKILDQLDYNTNFVEIICVDRNKEVSGYNLEALDIERVPTFIFYSDDAEKGRIIETPQTTLEFDSYSILK
ncbi:MAG: thioredoxin family protein [Bacteroidales bacterium]|nr:thioredoxin family protein [Bacteroidales bacterium]MCF8403603.1 thioredoxin family protein [Bacteroidales bacterium]